MRHGKAGRKLNRTSAHRHALFRNLITALIRFGRIRTTDAKAKELKRLADRVVTIGKQDTLAARRRAFDKLRDRQAVVKLFGELAARFKDRPGGYTRIVKLGVRSGDAAPISLVEWTGGEAQAGKRSKGKKPRAKKAAPAHDHDHDHAPKKRAAAG